MGWGGVFQGLFPRGEETAQTVMVMMKRFSCFWSTRWKHWGWDEEEHPWTTQRSPLPPLSPKRMKDVIAEQCVHGVDSSLLQLSHFPVRLLTARGMTGYPTTSVVSRGQCC